MTTFNLPTATISFTINDRTLELDVVDAVMMMETATANIPPNESKQVVDSIRNLFSLVHNVDLSSSQVMAISTAIRSAYNQLKKKLDSELKSTFGSDSVPTSPTVTAESSTTRSPTSGPPLNEIDGLQQLNQLANQLNALHSRLPTTST